MTAQISDTISFKEKDYDLIRVEGGELISPQQFGMEAEMITTSCYRGFYVRYELTYEGLYLRELTLKEKHGRYLPIEGIEPENARSPYDAAGERVYVDLSVPVPFSGTLRMARGLIEEFYVPMGIQEAVAYKRVYDVTLDRGGLVCLIDRSKEMKQRRGTFNEGYETGDLVPMVEEALNTE